jgi:hypothetical protein
MRRLRTIVVLGALGGREDAGMSVAVPRLLTARGGRKAPTSLAPLS